MPFIRYQISSIAEGHQLHSPQKVMLSGPNGVISQYLLANPSLAEVKWTLTPDQIGNLVTPPEPAPFWIVFEQRDHGDLRLSRLEQITGLSTQRTELLINLSPLEVLADESSPKVKVPSGGRTWNEELALDNGILDPKGPWKWAERTLNIGSTVVGKSVRAPA